MGENIGGPSLIAVPEWVENPLGKYYLYFAHHDGTYMRMAYSDELTGPWQVYSPGVLSLAQSEFAGHIASPDVHVDHEARQIRLYFHGSDFRTDAYAAQHTKLALSGDGLSFTTNSDDLGPAYLRLFLWQGFYYGLAMPGVFFRSVAGLSSFEQGITLPTPAMRHNALVVKGNTLSIYYSSIGDWPEHILCSRIELTEDWTDWSISETVSVLKPEQDFEGFDCPFIASSRGMAETRLHQLRDPGIFCEGNREYLLYSVAGESGIGLAEMLVSD